MSHHLSSLNVPSMGNNETEPDNDSRGIILVADNTLNNMAVLFTETEKLGTISLKPGENIRHIIEVELMFAFNLKFVEVIVESPVELNDSPLRFQAKIYNDFVNKMYSVITIQVLPISLDNFRNKINNIILQRVKTNFETICVQNRTDVIEFVKKVFPLDITVRETVIALFINGAREIHSYYVLAQGGAKSATVDLAMLAACCVGSFGCILIHNHPSGNLEPSKNDLELQKSLKKVMKTMGLTLYDNIIIGPNFEYKSFLTKK